MHRFSTLAMFFALAAPPALAVEGTTSVASKEHLVVSGLEVTPTAKPNLTFGGGTLGPSVTFEQWDLNADFAPWLAVYAVRVDALLRAVAVSGEPIGDMKPGARLRAEANRLDAIHEAAAAVRDLHVKVRINE
jgi:hypothetical protein